MSHFKLTTETKSLFGITLYRVEAVTDLPLHGVKAGDKGGYVEKESNLRDNAWVSGDAKVYGNAQVSGYALVYGYAKVSGYALVYGYAKVSGYALVFGDALVSGDAQVFGDARVFGDAQVFGDARVYGDAKVSSDEHILSVYPIGSEQVTATLFRTSSGHVLAVGCWSGTVDLLADEVERRSELWYSTESDQYRWRAEYVALEALCRARISGWTPPGKETDDDA